MHKEFSTDHERLNNESDIEFAMSSNGFQRRESAWEYNGELMEQKVNLSAGLAVSLFGPGAEYSIPHFFYVNDADPDLFLDALGQTSVSDTLSRLRETDADQAERVAYMLGGIIRDRSSHLVNREGTTNMVDFAARMINLGDSKSKDAVAAAISMYILSGGSTEEDNHFKGSTYFMSDAISNDPVNVRTTIDLGLSQVHRLHGFIEGKNGWKPVEIPDVAEDLEIFSAFPTVGAEFHLPPRAVIEDNTLLKRLALLNMSQHQDGSFIQFSRDDRGVIEIRMNPSVYPVTIANWTYMQKLIPELSKAYFTMTFNTPRGDSNFTWKNSDDKLIINRLKKLGLISYAAFYQDLPKNESRGEISFGDAYLGQTVRLDENGFDLTGYWGGEEGESGQLGIYAGMGDNFPYLAYYPSMGLANPSILESLGGKEFDRVKTIHSALELPSKTREDVIREIVEGIGEDPILRDAAFAGNRIISSLTSL